MYYLLLYDVIEDFIDRRVPFRQEHLDHADEARRRGQLVMAGAFSEPVDGAALLFRCDDSTVVTQFAEADPLRPGRSRHAMAGKAVERRRRYGWLTGWGGFLWRQQMIRGSCLCGGIAFEAADQIEFRNCHCSRCRKSRGAAYASNVYVRPADFRWLRGEDLLASYRLHGSATLRQCVLPGLRLPDAARRSDARFCSRVRGRARWRSGHSAQTTSSWSRRVPWHEITDELPWHEESPDPVAEEV